MQSLHTKVLKIVSKVILILVLIDATAAFADYHPSIPVPVCLGPIESEAESHGVGPDGCGGCYIVWKTRRYFVDPNLPDRMDIVLQQVDATGESQFGDRGVTIQQDVGDSDFVPIVVADGFGGAFVAWLDYAPGSYGDLMVNRVDNLGRTMWTHRVGSAENWPISETGCILPDGYGGCFVVYTSGSNYVVRISSTGDELWREVNSSYSEFGWYFDAVLDYTGGLVVAWAAGDFSNKDIIFQRYTKNGTKKWYGGRSVCTASNSQLDPHIARDGRDGYIIVWRDLRSQDGAIYAQRVDTTGTLHWTQSYTGLPVQVGDWAMHRPRLVPDGKGGAWIGWNDGNSGLMVQKISKSGSLLWGDGGQSLYSSGSEYDMIPLSSERVYFIAQDNVITADIYGKHGIQTTFIPGTEPRFIGDGVGGLIVVHNEYHNSYGECKYAQHINQTGALGSLGPGSPSVSDIPNDQGGWVNIQFSRAARDFPVDCGYPINSYGIWRRVDNVALAASVSSQANSGDADLAYLLESIPVVKIGSELYVSVNRDKEKGASKASMGGEPQQGFPQGAWQFIGNVPAVQQEEYNALAATNGDSSPNTPVYTDFVVTAHTSTPSVWYISGVGSGSSTDDIAPQAPQSVSAQTVEGSLSIEWNPNPENDLSHYAVYRASTPDFVPDAANRIGQSTEAQFIDEGWSFEGSYYYKVSALDHSQNESGWVLLPPVQGSSDVTESHDTKLELHQNHPNPFNPSTTISFVLPNTMRVSLSIYDAAGRLVRTLADDELGAGLQKYMWNGTNAHGTSVATGVYFYRLQTGNSLLTKKMILVK